jgi:S1-C subfamily serine protease
MADADEAPTPARHSSTGDPSGPGPSPDPSTPTGSAAPPPAPTGEDGPNERSGAQYRPDSYRPDSYPGDDAFARPGDVSGPFAPHQPIQPQPQPRPLVSPFEAAEFGRPMNGGEGFAPRPGERIAPRHGAVAAPVHPALTQTFGRTGTEGADGFDPAPGTRLGADVAPESPWWKADAERDPWRDPGSPFWLGQPAVFSAGQPEQLEPAQDSEFVEVAEDQEKVPDNDQDTSGSAKRRRFGLTALTLSLVIALIAGGVGGGLGWWFTSRADSALHTSNVKLGESSNAVTRPPGSVADIAKRVLPAVVSIDVRTDSEAGTGSGVVIDKNGYILTNNHVISAAASGGTITVTYNDHSTESARIAGRDPQTDLAVLKVTNPKLTVAALGDSSKVVVGDPVIAIGSPLGLQGTVTTGIISALDRPVHVSGDGSDSDAVIDAIQTDAAINPGNSGGALVDATGAVIGINSAIASLGTASGSSQSGSIGLGFAIPINEARTIAEELIKTGKAVHASIGLATRSVTDGSREGAYIVQVVPNGPGSAAGLKEGDVITALDGATIDSGDALSVAVQARKPGDQVKVTYFRGSQQRSATVTLATS